MALGADAAGESLGNINSYTKSHVEIDTVNFKENSSVKVYSQANVTLRGNNSSPQPNDNRTQDTSAQINIDARTQIKTGGSQNYTVKNQIELGEELTAS